MPPKKTKTNIIKSKRPGPTKRKHATQEDARALYTIDLTVAETWHKIRALQEKSQNADRPATQQHYRLPVYGNKGNTKSQWQQSRTLITEEDAKDSQNTPERSTFYSLAFLTSAIKRIPAADHIEIQCGNDNQPYVIKLFSSTSASSIREVICLCPMSVCAVEADGKETQEEVSILGGRGAVRTSVRAGTPMSASPSRSTSSTGTNEAPLVLTMEPAATAKVGIAAATAEPIK
jgi:hypothetical protein